MATFRWTDDLATGNSFIDADHQKLITMVNALLDAMTEGRGNDVIDKVLNNLIIYTRSHFEREEVEMRRVNYAHAITHKAEHTKLLNQVAELKAKMDAGEKVSANSVFTFLSGWLRNHILDVDTQLAAALKSAH